MLDALCEAQRKGLQTGNAGYRLAAWQRALEAVGKVTSYPVQLQQIKSKYDTQKKDWKVWGDFCSQSGLGWDAEKGVPTGPPEVLGVYFEAHPEARKFCDRPIAFADKLAILLGQHATTTDEILETNDRDVDSVDSPPEISETSTPEPDRANTPTNSALGLRKRSVENTAKAEVKRQKKTGFHHLADAILSVTEQLQTSRDLLVNANKSATERLAEILVSGFAELTRKERSSVFNTLKENDEISLFLAYDKDMRKSWVQDILGAHDT